VGGAVRAQDGAADHDLRPAVAHHIGPPPPRLDRRWRN
jgi:hypothetical protein